MNDAERNAYHQNVRDKVKSHGYFATFVFGKTEPSFCYTTGAYESYGIPEVIVSSLPQNLSFELVDNYVKYYRENELRLRHKVTEVINRFPVYFIACEIDAVRDKVLATLRYYNGAPFTYVQAIYPDVYGKFPLDEGYDYDQELFGEPEY